MKAYSAVIAAGVTRVSLSVSTAIPDVIITTEVSSNLIDWSPGPVPTPITESATRELLQITLPIGPNLPRFARFGFKLAPVQF